MFAVLSVTKRGEGTAYQQLAFTQENLSFHKPFSEGDVESAPGAQSPRSANEEFTLGYFLQNDLRLNWFREVEDGQLKAKRRQCVLPLFWPRKVKGCSLA